MVRFTAILNNILGYYQHIPQIKKKVLTDFIKLKESRLLLKTFWSLATDPRLELRHQGLLALNLAFLSSLRMSCNLKTFESTLKFKKQKTVADSNLKSDYIFLFDPELRSMMSQDTELAKLDSLDKSHIQADQFIETYLKNSKEVLNSKVEVINFIRKGALISSLENSLENTKSRQV